MFTTSPISGKSPKQLPYYVCWYVTCRCNLSCKFCYAFKGLKDPLMKDIFGIGDALLRQGVQRVNLVGGEPFLSPHLHAIVARYSRRIGLSITTNGTFLTESAVARLVGKLDRLTVSLDAVTPDLARSIRGETYDVSNVLKGLRFAASRGIPLKINTVVTSSNLGEIPGIATFLGSLGPRIVWKLFQITKNPNVQVSIEALHVGADTIRRLATDLGSRLAGVRIEVADSEELSRAYIIVTPDGNVHVPRCLDYATLGNVRDANLGEILAEWMFAFRENENVYRRDSPTEAQRSAKVFQRQSEAEVMYV